MQFPFKKNSNSEKETSSIAAEFSRLINENKRIVLTGELGAGKTFFVKEILKQFDILEVNSPSFAIVNQYEGKIKVFHFDFYRLMNYEELLEIGWLDYLNDDDAIIFIEWGNLIPQAVPESRVEIIINVLDENSREFNFRKYGN